MKDNKNVPKIRGIYSQIARKHKVTRQAVQASLTSGGLKYAEDFITLVKKNAELTQELSAVLKSMQKVQQ